MILFVNDFSDDDHWICFQLVKDRELRQRLEPNWRQMLLGWSPFQYNICELKIDG